MKMLKEDSYDDLDYYDEIDDESTDDFDDYELDNDELNYDDFKYNETKSGDSEYFDSGTNSEDEYQEDARINTEENLKEPKKTDWSRYGLDKKYSDKKFDINKANQLFYTFKEDSDYEFDTKSQIESIRYATYYAARNDNDAKNFVISIIQNKNIDAEVGNVAKYAFWLFFRNYVRVEITKFYNKQTINDYEKMLRITDALQQCFLYIFEHIDGYNPSIARINTYFNNQVIRGAVLEWEALRRGRSSKQTMRIDKLITKAQRECKEMGIEPTNAILANMSGRSFNEVQTALARINAENTLSTYDTPDVNNKGSFSSETFMSPENKVLEAENTKELIQKLNTLKKEDREILLMSLGLIIIDDTLESVQPLSNKDIATKTGLSNEKIQQIINMSIRALRKAYNVKLTRSDNLISGKGLFFEPDAGNSDNSDALNDIIDIK